MASSPEPKRRRPKNRREQILNVAAELIAERGFAAVSVQDIGERTGITGGAIYRHFPNKQAVLETLLVNSITMYLDQAVPTIADAATEQQFSLRPLIDGALDIVERHQGHAATYVREFRRAEPARRQELRSIEVQVARCWRTAILERQPKLSRSEATARQQAALGALNALSLRPEMLRNARALVLDALESVLGSPPMRAVRASEPVATWVGPVTRREQIVSAATRLFSRSGFHGVGFNEVGEAVGIAGPSIYEYFDSKMDILLEVFDQTSALVTAGALQAIRQATHSDEALDLLIASYVDVCSKFTELVVVTAREGSSLPPEARPRLVRHRRDVQQTWIQVLREVHPTLSTSEARVLVRTSFAIVLELCRVPVESRLSMEANVALLRAYFAAEPQPPDVAPSPISREGPA